MPTGSEDNEKMLTLVALFGFFLLQDGALHCQQQVPVMAIRLESGERKNIFKNEPYLSVFM